MAQISKKIIFNTELNADSVEWCPIKNYRCYFICGTYQLSKSEISEGIKKKNAEELRKGHLYLFRLVHGPEMLQLVEQMTLVGILDCKWAHRLISNNVFLAVATALGDVRIFKIHGNTTISLKQVSTYKLSSSDTALALSLDWSTGLNESDIKIVISDSEGYITLVSFTDGQMSEDCKWKSHDFEAWIVAFNYWNTNLFYSGGDDCHLCTYDRRTGKFAKKDRAHTAGVTSMHMNLKKEYDFISGSYDEYVAFWDVRQMKEPKKLLKVYGGVWRLKWEPNNCNYIAAACMHNGFATIDGTSYSILAEYKEHSSLAYGIDWSFLQESEITEYFNVELCSSRKLHVLAMCSFYDNLLSVALFKKPEVL